MHEYLIKNKKILSINNFLTIETEIKNLSKNTKHIFLVYYLRLHRKIINNTQLFSKDPTKQKAFYNKTSQLKNKSNLIIKLSKLLFFFSIFFFLGLHYTKKFLKLILLLVRVGVKVIIVKVAFHCFGSIIFFFKFLFNKKILSLNAIVKKILYSCIMDYLPIDPGFFSEKTETFQIFFSLDNSSDEEDKKMPARDIAGSGDDNDNSAAAGSLNAKK